MLVYLFLNKFLTTYAFSQVKPCSNQAKLNMDLQSYESIKHTINEATLSNKQHLPVMSSNILIA